MYDDHHAISADSHHDGDPIAGSHTADTIDKDFLLHEVSDAAKAQNNGTVTKDEYDNFIEFLVHIRVLLDGVDLSHDESISGATSTLIQIVDEIQVPNLGHFASHTVLSAIEALWHAGHCYYLISLFVLYAHAEDLHGHLESLISVLGDVSNVTAGSPPTVDGSDGEFNISDP